VQQIINAYEKAEAKKAEAPAVKAEAEKAEAPVVKE
jgi:hypothetical protein